MHSNKLSKDLSNLIGMFLLLGIIAAVFSWMFFYSKQLSAISQNRQDRAEVVEDIKGLEELDKATQTLHANYLNIASDRDAILNLLPTTDEAERLLLLLSDYAQSSQVILESFAPEQTVSTSAQAEGLGFEKYITQATIVGKYSSILKFIKLLETGSRFVDIDSYTFTTSALGSGNPDLEVSFNITSYYQTPTTEAGVSPDAANLTVAPEGSRQ